MSNIPIPLRLVSALLGGLLFWSCQAPKEEVAREVVRPVRVWRVEASEARMSRSFSGVAKSGLESDISFRVAGTIQRLPVRVGDRLRKGQLIAEVDPVDYDLKVAETRAAVRQAQAQLTNATANYERILGLYEKNNATQADYDTATTAVDSARATLEAAEKRLEQALQQRTYTRLSAPVAGVISEVHVELNENVAPGRPVVTLDSGIQPEVEVAVPEQLISQIRRGSQVSVRFDAIPGTNFPGRVTEVGVGSTRLATTFAVTVQLSRVDSRVRPGMAAEVFFPTEEPAGKDRISVPPHTVGEDRQGRFVYVLEPESDDLGHVNRRSVHVGELSSEGLEVVEGLHIGELLVTAGIDRLEPGLRVKILEP